MLILLQILIQQHLKVKKIFDCVNYFLTRLELDYDPEDILEPLNDNNENSDNDNDADESGARDHYLSVGKSKLRNEQPLLDDPRYAGKRTSRKDIYSEDEEEVASDNDEEVSNDDEEDLVASANSDQEDDEQVDEEEQSEEETEDVEGDDEINVELRRIQEEEKYVSLRF